MLLSLPAFLKKSFAHEALVMLSLHFSAIRVGICQLRKLKLKYVLMNTILLRFRRCPRASRQLTHLPRRWINYGHDMHQEMLNGTAKVSVTEYDDGGFVINGVNMRGGVALFSEIAMLWKPRKIEEITREHLAVFMVSNPPLEILVLGCGERISHGLPAELKELLKVNGIVVEYMDTVNACATFNILNAEDRPVAAALLPCDPNAGNL